jgi:PKD repeat protein
MAFKIPTYGLRAAAITDKTEVEVFENIQFTDETVGSNSWLWDFGDGTTSTLQNPIKSYAADGTFSIRLIATKDDVIAGIVYYEDLIVVNTPIDPDALAFILAAGITNPTQIAAIGNLVTQLKTASLWNNMQALYPFVGGTASSHKYNLKDPRDLNAAGRLEYRNSTVTHDANGITFLGTGYASTWCVPGTSVYNRSYGEYIRQAFNDGWSGATTTPYNAYLGFKVNSVPRVTGIGVNNLAGVSFALSYGYLTTSILSSSQGYLLNNSSILSSNTSPLVTPALGVIYLGTANLGTAGNSTPYSEWANRTLSFAHLGDGLTPTQHTSLASIVQTYQTALGRNV